MGPGSFVSASHPAVNHPSPVASLPPPSLSLMELVNDFLKAKARANRSDRYLWALRNSLSKFTYGRARTPAGDITPEQIEKWLAASSWANRTKRGYLSDVSILYSYAIKRGLLTFNPARAVELPTFVAPPPQIHSPAQVKTVLKFARRYQINICRALAIRYFAGLRSSEVDRIEETEISERFIEVTAAKCKTRRRRLVEVCPTLSAWLALGGVLPVLDVSQRWRMFTAALLKAEGITWPSNVTRHSFCSYHLAQHQNAGKTAFAAGHSEQMLFAHYRELVTPDAAAEFWAIRPD